MSGGSIGNINAPDWGEYDKAYKELNNVVEAGEKIKNEMGKEKASDALSNDLQQKLANAIKDISSKLENVKQIEKSFIGQSDEQREILASRSANGQTIEKATTIVQELGEVIKQFQPIGASEKPKKEFILTEENRALLEAININDAIVLVDNSEEDIPEEISERLLGYTPKNTSEVTSKDTKDALEYSFKISSKKRKAFDAFTLAKRAEIPNADKILEAPPTKRRKDVLAEIANINSKEAIEARKKRTDEVLKAAKQELSEAERKTLDELERRKPLNVERLRVLNKFLSLYKKHSS